MEALDLDLVEQDRMVASVAAASVLTLEGKRIRLRELWDGGVVVTTFLRQFGCLFCHRAIAEVVAIIPDVLARGGRLVFVGNGSIDQAKRFYAEKKLPREGVTVVTDPERESFLAAEMNRGFAKTFFNGGSVAAYRDARHDGHRITGLFGDLTQLGGTMVTRPPARLVMLHRSQFAGDHANAPAILDAVTSPSSG
jgi:hypothetical protein